MFKIGVATAAAAAGAILAITSVFAHATPNTNGRSLVGSIVSAAHSASFPVFTNELAPTTLTDEQAQDAQEAAELAAEIAAQQAAEAAEQAQDAAELAAEQAAEAAETDEDAAEVEQADTTDQESTQVAKPTTESDSSGDHQGD